MIIARQTLTLFKDDEYFLLTAYHLEGKDAARDKMVKKYKRRMPDLGWENLFDWLIKRQRTHSIYGLRPSISFSQVRDELRCKGTKIILTSIKISWNFIIQKNFSISCIFSNIISNIYSCSRVLSSQNYLIRIMYKILRF